MRLCGKTGNEVVGVGARVRRVQSTIYSKNIPQSRSSNPYVLFASSILDVVENERRFDNSESILSPL